MRTRQAPRRPSNDEMTAVTTAFDRHDVPVLVPAWGPVYDLVVEVERLFYRVAATSARATADGLHLDGDRTRDTGGEREYPVHYLAVRD